MDKETAKKVIDFLNAKSATGPCEACGASEWQLLSEELFLNHIKSDGAITVGRGIPCVGLACTRCGNIRTYSSVRVGIRDKSK